MTKRCYKCGETKPRSEFQKDKYRKDELRYYCKSCAVLIRSKNSDKKQTKTLLWQKNNKDSVNKIQAKSQLKHRNKRIKDTYLCNLLKHWDTIKLLLTIDGYIGNKNTKEAHIDINRSYKYLVDNLVVHFERVKIKNDSKKSFVFYRLITTIDELEHNFKKLKEGNDENK